MNAIIADPNAPAKLRRSVKFGTINEISVITQTIAVLTPIYFSLLILLEPALKNLFYSTMSKATRIYTG